MRNFRTRKFNKESLYEELMTTISKQVKKALNEDEYEDYSEVDPVEDVNDTLLSDEEENDDMEDLSVDDVELDNSDSYETADDEDIITDEPGADEDDETETEQTSEPQVDPEASEVTVETTETTKSPKEIMKTEAGKNAMKFIDTLDDKLLYDFANIMNSKKQRKQDREDFINALIVLSKYKILKNLDERRSYRYRKSLNEKRTHTTHK